MDMNTIPIYPTNHDVERALHAAGLGVRTGVSEQAGWVSLTLDSHAARRLIAWAREHAEREAS